MAQHKTKMGLCDVLRHNPYNGVSLLGHANGTVTMWAPNTGTPLVKMLVHRVRPNMLHPYKLSLSEEIGVEAWGGKISSKQSHQSPWNLELGKVACGNSVPHIAFTVGNLDSLYQNFSHDLCQFCAIGGLCTHASHLVAEDLCWTLALAE